jgi:dolichol-phosphate mannosyltransferase
MVPSVPELLVVMPVYNEQASIPRVIREWTQELNVSCISFTILAIDDGSSDGSLRILQALQQRPESHLTVVTRPNRGHGQTCLEGYRRARSLDARYVLQIDSDGQCDPRYFSSLWRLREQFTVVYGVRTRRDDGLPRVLVSRILRLMLWLVFRVNCPDANVPYRLMRTRAIQSAVGRIPSDFHLANAALAILLAKDRKCSHGFVPITFRLRYGGASSLKGWLFVRKALDLLRDTRKMLREGAQRDGNPMDRGADDGREADIP